MDQLKSSIYLTLSDLPPISLVEKCITAHQLAELIEIRELYKSLHQSFKEYFGGQAETAYYQLHKRVRKLYVSYRNYYLAFYSVVQYGWVHIEKNAKKKKVDLRESYGVSCPGDALVRTMQLDCLAICSPIFAVKHEWTPGKARRLAKEDREIGKSIALGNIDRKRLKKYQKEVRETQEIFAPYTNFKESCIVACQRAKGDQSLKKYLKQYQVARSELDMQVQYFLNKGSAKGFQWFSGTRIPSRL